MPPTTLSASRTTGWTPRLVNWYAAVSPPGPAPAITTGSSCAIVSFLRFPCRPGTRILGRRSGSGDRNVEEGQEGVAGECRREEHEDEPLGPGTPDHHCRRDGQRERAEGVALERIEVGAGHRHGQDRRREQRVG